jgi:hypothetical protein
VTCSFTLCVWITNLCLVTGHALAADLTPQSAIDSIESVLIGFMWVTYAENYVLAPKNIAKNIYVEKTYHIRKVGRGGGQAGLQK